MSVEEEEPKPAEEYQDPQGDREREKEHAEHKTPWKKPHNEEKTTQADKPRRREEL